MRLKSATKILAGTAVVAAFATLAAASPAWACSDSDPALKLQPTCGAKGPDWMVQNPNGWGAVPFTWADDTGRHSRGLMWAPPNGGIALPTHASKVIVVAYRPDKGRFPKFPVWKKHGAFGQKHCLVAHPSPTPTKPAPSHRPKPTHTVTPSPTSSAPSGEARPATPVKAQPNFTG